MWRAESWVTLLILTILSQQNGPLFRPTQAVPPVSPRPTRDYRYCQMLHETMIKLFDDQYHVLKRLEANQEKKKWADQNGRKAKKRRLN